MYIVVLLSLTLVISEWARAGDNSSGRDTLPKNEIKTPQCVPDSLLLTTAVDIDTVSDSNWVNLGRRIPRGISYEKCRGLFPSLGRFQTEGGGSMEEKYGLYEARLQIKFRNVPTTVEFNFQSDKLYYVYFHVRNIDSITARSVCDFLKSKFDSLYGESRLSSEEENYYSEIYSWELGSTTRSIIFCMYGTKNCYVGWD